MINTEILSVADYYKYATWIRDQDPETQKMYFGIHMSNDMIDSLMDKIIVNSNNHFFLIAKEGDAWVGSTHIAINGKTVEFGIIVRKDYRGKGIADQLLDESIVWARNRRYTDLYMHCLGWNRPIKHLCEKYGLTTQDMYGDSEVQFKLAPANWITLGKEVAFKQRNAYHMFLQNSQKIYREIYG